MLTGKHFRLDAATLAVMQGERHRIAVTIPPGGIVQVISGLNGERMIDVLWDGRILNMFFVNLNRAAKSSPRLPGRAVDLRRLSGLATSCQNGIHAEKVWRMSSGFHLTVRYGKIYEPKRRGIHLSLCKPRSQLWKDACSMEERNDRKGSRN